MPSPAAITDPRAMRYLRALGWAAIAAAPILLGTLALVSAKPEMPASLPTNAAFASWIAGALAFAASLLRSRRARLARVPIAMSALVVIGFSAFLVWLSSAIDRLVPLDARESADLVERGERLEHPRLDFSIAAPGIPRSNAAAEARSRGGTAWARSHRVWTWADDDTELSVDLSRVARVDRAVLHASLEGLARPLRNNGHEVDVVEQDTSGQVETELGGGGTAVARVMLFEKRGRAYRLLVSFVTRDPDRWRAWLDQARAR